MSWVEDLKNALDPTPQWDTVTGVLANLGHPKNPDELLFTGPSADYDVALAMAMIAVKLPYSEVSGTPCDKIRNTLLLNHPHWARPLGLHNDPPREVPSE